MTKATTKKVSPEIESPSTSIDAMRVLKVDECPSLSGSTILQFHIGVDAKNDVNVRISGNSGGGIWTPCWVPVKAVHAEFAHNGNRALTSREFLPGLHGKSSNNFGFLAAALLHLGLVERAPEEEGKFVRGDGKAFMAEMQKLIDAKVSLDVSMSEKKSKVSNLAEKPAKAKKSEASTAPASTIDSSLVVPGSLEAA